MSRNKQLSFSIYNIFWSGQVGKLRVQEENKSQLDGVSNVTVMIIVTLSIYLKHHEELCSL